MEALFIKILNMSLTAGWLVLAVIVLRFTLKKAPKSVHCLLWMMVGLRLICPLSIESAFSLIPSAEPVQAEVTRWETVTIESGIPAVDSVVNRIIGDSMAGQGNIGEAEPSFLQRAVKTVAFVWGIGVAGLFLYSVVSDIKLRCRVRVSLPAGDSIYLCDNINSPFILGVIKPRIYLPSTLSEQQISGVVAHEKAHLKRRDHWWKPLGFALLVIYWFNPLLWIAYVLFCRDIEMACDERVIKNLDSEKRKVYSETLLSLSIPLREGISCPLAFGEVGVKDRIKLVLNDKKPSVWVMIAAAAVCVITAVCFLTNPSERSGIMEFKAMERKSAYTTCEDVTVCIGELELDEEVPFVEIVVENTSGKTIEYWPGFTLYYRDENGTVTECETRYPVAFDFVIYTTAEKAWTRKFVLHPYDLSKAGDYIIEFEFSFRNEETTHIGCVEF